METPELFNWRAALIPIAVELELGPVIGWRCLRVFGVRIAVWAVVRR